MKRGVRRTAPARLLFSVSLGAARNGTGLSTLSWPSTLGHATQTIVSVRVSSQKPSHTEAMPDGAGMGRAAGSCRPADWSQSEDRRLPLPLMFSVSSFPLPEVPLPAYAHTELAPARRHRLRVPPARRKPAGTGPATCILKG
jgi:hypothetical protein